MTAMPIAATWHLPQAAAGQRKQQGSGAGLLALLALVLTLGACSSLPQGSTATPSMALAPMDDSPLVRTASQSSPDPALSGVRLLPLGSYSLDARLQLIGRARHSIDLQYYVLDNDSTGRLLLSRLADAAARGVRVRLLVDDLYTTHSDSLLRAMDATHGVQVRLFNPSWRAAAAA